jgi:hypothetical protein
MDDKQFFSALRSVLVAPSLYQHDGGDDYGREYGEAQHHVQHEERDGYRRYRQHDKNEQPYGIV